MESAFDALNVRLQLPDIWQQEAVAALLEGQDVVLDAPTGAGKTWVFELFKEQRKGNGQLVYTVPTRALANDKRSEWSSRRWDVGIATGDVAENLQAPVLVATLETQLERLLEGSGPRLLVIDEYQMIGDPQRGLHYESAIALAPAGTQLLLMSGSVSNGKALVSWLERLGRKARLVQSSERPVPLEEMPQCSLPREAPRQLTGFFPRLSAEVLMAGLDPFLIFAPLRSKAESIARQLASSLQEPRSPLRLTEGQRRICGKELSRMLERRIAYHHSGLPHAARAEVVEPLAKAGELRVIVATTGLAAGINFSVKSVLVSSIYYREGLAERMLQPSELLQMFGRAGRRGKDEVGYVISAGKTPRLLDAHAEAVKRGNAVDWPSLLRVMDTAVKAEKDGPEAAREFCQRLFSEQKIVLGFSEGAEAGPNEERLFDELGPLQKQMMDSQGKWQRAEVFGSQSSPLSRAKAFHKGEWRPALQVASVAQGRLWRGARLCRVGNEGNEDWCYAGEEAVGQEREGKIVPNKRLAKLLRSKRGEALSPERLEQGLGKLRKQPLLELRSRGEQWVAKYSLAEEELPVFVDLTGAALLNPFSRVVKGEVRDNVLGQLHAVPGTAAYAWRKLGLIEADGTPTQRGQICSFFAGGEGLAVAAGLEDAYYPVDELVWHLANLRGGYRFEEVSGEAEVLEAACRAAYGPVSYEGYLEAGLPVSYGCGAAEALRGRLEGKTNFKGREWDAGDLERVRLEWLSLLRHIAHAPKLAWRRWQALQAQAGELAAQYRVD